ncbi:MAG: hypothetical protein HY092_00815 [Candidatus Kerfeldbacteria bacterium]|nr:hypothetical protein [Candidatus Kerfeldbacteria bacterium]
MSNDPITKQDLKEFGQNLEQRLTTTIHSVVNSAVDELGGMIKQGFDHVDERFAAVDRRFDGIDQHLGRIDLRLPNVAYKMDVDHLTRRVDRIERRIGIDAE